jgi:hypothetical protein
MKKGARRRPKFHSCGHPSEHPTRSEHLYMLASQCGFTMAGRPAFRARLQQFTGRRCICNWERSPDENSYASMADGEPRLPITQR